MRGSFGPFLLFSLLSSGFLPVVVSATPNPSHDAAVYLRVQSNLPPSIRELHRKPELHSGSPVVVEVPKTTSDPYVPGWSLPVRWRYVGTPPGLARILLLKNDQTVAVLHPGVPWGTRGTGAFKAVMPPDQFGFNSYRVRVVSTADERYAGTGEEFIAMPQLRITSPVTDGQTWKVGQPVTITWRYSGGCGDKVGIKAIQTSYQWAYDLQAAWPIGSSWQGSFPWTVPASIPAGEYRLYFRSASGACTDRTAVFNIAH